MFTISGNSISLISGDDGVLVVHPRNITLTGEDYAILSARKVTSQGERGELLMQMIEHHSYYRTHRGSHQSGAYAFR